MRRVYFGVFCILLFAVNVSFFSESITITTSARIFHKEVSLDCESIELFSDEEQSGKEVLQGIQGLAKYKKIKQIKLVYFYEVSLQTLDCVSPVALIIQNSNITNVNELLSKNIDALLLQSCIFPKNLMVNAKNSRVQYLEISNAGLTKIPIYEGSIPLINLSANEIQTISKNEKRMYIRSKKVLLFNNIIEIDDGVFISKGNAQDFIPKKWYKPQ